MKKSITITCFLFTLSLGLAQDKSVLDRLGAHRLTSQNVYLVYVPASGTFEYRHASDGGSVGTVENDQYFAYSGGNLFHVQLGFVNPLRYKIEVTSNSVDNPTVQSYEDFLNTFSTAFTGIDQIAAIAPTPALISISSLRPVGSAPKIVPSVRTMLLHEWYYRLLESGSTAHTQAKDDALAVLVTSLEDILYGKVALKGNPQKLTVEEWLSKFKKNLYYSKDLKTFQANHIGILDSLSDLTALVTTATNAYETIKTILGVDKNTSYLNNSDIQPSFTNYSLNTLGNFTRTVDPLINSRNGKVKEFKSYMGSLSSSLVEFKDYSLSMKKRTDLQVKVTLTEFDLNGKELEKKYQTEFHVVYFQPLVPYFSAALAWSPHKFYNYSIATNGTENVIQESSEKRYWQPAVFLNWFLNLKQDDFHIILPQVGVGTGGELPIIYTGLGLAIRERLAITGGYSFAFEKRLSSKQPGDIVADESILKADLTREVSGKGYLSLSYRVGK